MIEQVKGTIQRSEEVWLKNLQAAAGFSAYPSNQPSPHVTCPKKMLEEPQINKYNLTYIKMQFI